LARIKVIKDVKEEVADLKEANDIQYQDRPTLLLPMGQENVPVRKAPMRKKYQLIAPLPMSGEGCRLLTLANNSFQASS
jgi:hypothetical protein